MIDGTHHSAVPVKAGGEAIVLRRLRHLLFALAAGTSAATILELTLSEHTEEALQLLPFGLCSLALAATSLAWANPRRIQILLLRGVMALVAFGGAYGIYVHFGANLAFELEIRPNATAGDVLLDTLMGASPLLAPGILTLSAVLAAAATLGHPGLRRVQDAPVGESQARP